MWVDKDEVINSYIKLLSEIIIFRDECRSTKNLLPPDKDTDGNARLAYEVCANQLTTMIEGHQFDVIKKILIPSNF